MGCAVVSNRPLCVQLWSYTCRGPRPLVSRCREQPGFSCSCSAGRCRERGGRGREQWRGRKEEDKLFALAPALDAKRVMGRDDLVKGEGLGLFAGIGVRVLDGHLQVGALGTCR
eukprot:2270456-Rhodomonas_salina.1